VKHCLIAKITTVLQHAPLVRNLARKKFIARFVLGLCKSRNVQFCEVSHHLNDRVKLASNETRIQDFFREAALDYLALAGLLVSLLPGTGKLRLCLDRTEWDFGQCQVNILLVTVGRGDCHWPLCWELLDNRSGNSNAADRTALLDFCLQVLGPHRVGLVVGDREFVGHKWFKYLKDKNISFVMRLPKHHLLTDRQGRRQAIADWNLRPGQCRQVAECQVDGVWGGAQVTALAGGEHLFLFGTANPAYLGQLYRKRWTIEACFQNLKGRGFALRGTHLHCRAKLKKLVGLVSLAYAFCVSVGTQIHEKVQPIGTKNHGYKRASFSRHGLNALRQYSRPGRRADPVFSANMNALFRWIINQVPLYQTTKIVG
jgi:hypothetical protein